jgi:hypothetical protein
MNGHLDRPGGNPAVFWDLHKLHVGDKVIVVDPYGRTLQFHVIRVMFYPPQDAPIQDIFGNKAGRFLNLTTCAGDWIPTQHQTALRLVVYTALGSLPNASTPGATSTSSTVQPSPTAAPPSLVPFQVTGIYLAVSPASIAGLLCGISVTFTYTATFHAVSNSGGARCNSSIPGTAVMLPPAQASPSPLGRPAKPSPLCRRYSSLLLP